MERFAMLTAVVAMLVFASPATAQTSDAAETATPESAGQSQYQYGSDDGPSTQQAIEQGIEDAVEDAQENDAAVDGTEAYIGALSPEEAEASEAEASEEEVVESSASARYENLPDTGGSAIFTLPFAGAASILLAGGWLIRRVHTHSG